MPCGLAEHGNSRTARTSDQQEEVEGNACADSRQDTQHEDAEHRDERKKELRCADPGESGEVPRLCQRQHCFDDDCCEGCVGEVRERRCQEEECADDERCADEVSKLALHTRSKCDCCLREAADGHETAAQTTTDVRRAKGEELLVGVGGLSRLSGRRLGAAECLCVAE